MVKALFGRPNSYDGGSHIGLLQLQWTRSDVDGAAEAWDWQKNIQDGVNIFFAYAEQAARRLAGKIVAGHVGLSQPADLMLEQMAVAIYHGHASGPSGQYYTTTCSGRTAKGKICIKGVWTWIVNNQTVNEQESSMYVAKVYANLAS